MGGCKMWPYVCRSVHTAVLLSVSAFSMINATNNGTAAGFFSISMRPLCWLHRGSCSRRLIFCLTIVRHRSYGPPFWAAQSNFIQQHTLLASKNHASTHTRENTLYHRQHVLLIKPSVFSRMTDPTLLLAQWHHLFVPSAVVNVGLGWSKDHALG